MEPGKKEQIRALLKAIETGEPEPVAVVNEAQYIQHNPLTREGSEGLAALFLRLSKTSPRVEVVRVFEDGDFVFGHTDYDFNVREVGFEVFRFEKGQVVEHWDNLQLKPEGVNPSGHTMLDGAIDAVDLDKTEANRERVRSFVDEVLIGGAVERLPEYVHAKSYVEHNPSMGDGIAALRQALEENLAQNSYEKRHRLLAEGSFVLSVCEGQRGADPVSFYDLFRLIDGTIVEHWDTVDVIPPRSEWVNENGKF